MTFTYRADISAVALFKFSGMLQKYSLITVAQEKPAAKKDANEAGEHPQFSLQQLHGRFNRKKSCG